MQQTDYSVLMSVYLKEQALFLRESIESMLSQTIMPKDFVIVCDGPLTEELDTVVSEYEERFPELFQVIRIPENVGLGRALNEGMKHCRCEYIARMDSDDISLPNRMEKQLAVLNGQQVDIVSGTLTEFDEAAPDGTHKRSLPETHEQIRKFARRRNPFNHPCVCYKKTSVIKSGGYEHFEGFEDYYLWVRMLMAGMRGYNLQDTILKMRATGMHGRRGGFRYASSIIKFRLYLLKSGFCSFGDFIYTVTGHVAVSILPNRLRQLFYHRVLRKR
ncbi:MAG: glycosyltransferase [Lachnospiraceae bacterium]|nr:glycosyltransferase [Lachnospiraceae bacterium]